MSLTSSKVSVDLKQSKISAASRRSVKSLSVIEKPVSRIIKVDPPISSINDLLNEDPNASAVAKVCPDVINISKRLLQPHGSMESLVCGAAANDIGGLVNKSTNDASGKKDDTLGRAALHSPRSVSQGYVEFSSAAQSATVRSLHRSQIHRTPSAESYSWPKSLPLHLSTISWTAWLCVIIGTGCLTAVAIASSLFLGMLCGGFISYVILRAHTWLLNPDTVFVYLPTDTSDERQLRDITFHHPPHNGNESTEERIRQFQGWLNLLEEQKYDPETYHISNTETVFVRLEDTKLCLKKPLEASIPKRAIWNEPIHSTTFVKQIQIDLRNYAVELRPHNLSPTRIYNKRFPICLSHKKGEAHLQKPGELLFNKYNDESPLNRSPTEIILFSRTNKEKEEWYRRLDQASKGLPVTIMVLELQRLAQLRVQEEYENISNDDVEKLKEYQNKPPISKVSTLTQEALLERDHTDLLIDYMKYMIKVIHKCAQVELADSAKSIHTENIAAKDNKAADKISLTSRKQRNRSPDTQTSATATTDIPSVSITDCDTGTMWINAFLQRVFFDFFREQYWRDRIQNRLQKKLYKINLPYYLGALVIDQMSLGTSLPLLKRIGQPYLANDGLWIDSQLAYSGGAFMAIETKINLNMLRKEEKMEKKSHSSIKVNISTLARRSNDDSDDSSTSSENSTVDSPLIRDPKKGEHTVTKFFNSLKDSKYFQKLADTKLIKSAMEKVSNTPLKLYVEVKYIAGVFSVNIAPPPSDRIWLGFKGAPEIILTAKPIVGEKSVNLNKLSAWIEEKLATEFQREFVIPNMIDLRVALMCGNYRDASHQKKPK